MATTKSKAKIDPMTETEVIAAGEQAQELALVEDERLPVSQSATPMALIQSAVEAGRPIEYLKELMALEREWKADRAKEAFHKAMAGFRGEAVQIIKRKQAGFDHKSGGGRTEYNFADLSDAVDAAVPALSKWGLSHDWDTAQEDGLIAVTCTLTHELGHSKKTTLRASPDTSGSKNSIQAMGSTVSYLERYTFLAVTGLAAKGMDTDGGGAGFPEQEYIDATQVKKIKKLLKDTGTDEAKLLKWCKSESVETIFASKYEVVYARLVQIQRDQNSEQQDEATE